MRPRNYNEFSANGNTPLLNSVSQSMGAPHSSQETLSPPPVCKHLDCRRPTGCRPLIEKRNRDYLWHGTCARCSFLEEGAQNWTSGSSQARLMLEKLSVQNRMDQRLDSSCEFHATLLRG